MQYHETMRRRWKIASLLRRLFLAAWMSLAKMPIGTCVVFRVAAAIFKTSPKIRFFFQKRYSVVSFSLYEYRRQ